MSHLDWREKLRAKRAAEVPRTVLNIAPGECRWVTHRRTKEGLRVFCGQPSPVAKPYCEDHYGLVYVPAGKIGDIEF